ncbi:MAG: alpha/beta fold hydrolase [Chloroflexi bacterium]|nr:alpha/beta fold hydrolase [Chloroflexota bacterium]
MSTAIINGVEHFYEVAGDGPPLVLIHGMGLDRRMWDAQFARLASRCRVIRYDVRGHGLSGRPPTGYRDERFEDLRQLLMHLGIARTHLMGLSMGAEIAVGFTLRHPQMVRSLIAVDPYVEGYRFQHWDSKRVWTIARKKGPPEAVSYWITDPIFAPALQRPDVAARLRQMVAEHSGVMWADPGPYPRPTGPRDFERLEEITVPTLVIVGENDLPDFRAIASSLSARIVNAQHVVIPQASHMSPLEQPEEINKIVSHFLEEVRSSTSRRS